MLEAPLRVVRLAPHVHGARRDLPSHHDSPQGVALLSAMYGEEARAKELGLTGDELRAHRQTYIRPLAEDFLSWMNAVEPSLLPSDPLAQAIRYAKNHRGALLRFLDDSDLPIDNSPTERLFQNVARLRVNMLFAGSTEGAHRACVLLGITGTCHDAPGGGLTSYGRKVFEAKEARISWRARSSRRATRLTCH